MNDRHREGRAAYDAVIFDMDGVITRTARLHLAAWKRMFDEFLRTRPAATGGPQPAFGERDYREHVDGKPRHDGVRDFLRSRGIELPEGSPSDPPGAPTVNGLGSLKNRYFLRLLRERRAERDPAAIGVIRTLNGAGLAVAVVSASRNAAEVLESAGVAALFPVRVDGVVAAQKHLPGKPSPAIYLEAAGRLGVEPARAVVVEDALAGVAAGRAGGFSLVVGVDRSGEAEALREHGADVVIHTLDELPSVLSVGEGRDVGASSQEMHESHRASAREEERRE